ncbi:endo-1,4-beta-xylanase [Teichococcus coralli]|nr:endo-1,4-beta-xylanase [Pseudoroseomonas coralli]
MRDDLPGWNAAAIMPHKHGTAAGVGLWAKIWIPAREAATCSRAGVGFGHCRGLEGEMRVRISSEEGTGQTSEPMTRSERKAPILGRGGLPSRRRCLQALGGLLALSPSAPPRASEAVPSLPSLRDAAASIGLRYGAAAHDYPPVFTPEYDRLVVQQCGLIVPVLNWSQSSPSPDRFEENTDKGVVAWARAKGLPLTGSHLLWHEAVPRWFAALSDPREARQAVIAHIHRSSARLARDTWSVNVINEALNPGDRREDGLRRDAFSRLFGNSYWEFAFHAAREAFPDAVLVYNDYGMEQEYGDALAKRAALLRRLDALLAARVPVDAIGLQSHLRLRERFNSQSFAAFLGQIAARGVRVIITELDVLDIGAPSAAGPRDAAVADMYRRYLDAVLSERAVTAIVTWGLSDRYSWLRPDFSPVFSRPDGLSTRPLPFDSELRPKPAFDAILAAFRSAPHRNIEARGGG